ncbi:MAG: hypothetical protein K2M17_02355 [Bacilli bacterium]|nr:hypothetical protein [Bacilli bacterium]
MRKEIKTITAGVLVALMGMLAGVQLEKLEGVEVVHAAAYQKMADSVWLVDTNGEKWRFEGIPFRLQGDYKLWYSNDFQLIRLELDDQTIIEF